MSESLYLEKLVKDAEAFTSRLMREHYENGAGLKEETNIAELYKEYAHLFSREVVEEIAGARRRAAGGSPNVHETCSKELWAGLRIGDDSQNAPGADLPRRLRYLHEMVTDGYLGFVTRDLTDRLSSVETRATIDHEGKEVPYRYASVLLANEPDRARRGDLVQKMNRVMNEELNPMILEIYGQLYRAATDLGYEGYIALYQDIKGIDLFGFKKQMESLLQRTEAVYEKRMAEAMKREVGIDLTEAQKHDAGALFRARKYDSCFSQDGAVPTLKKTLAAMGIDLDAQRNIILDVEPRPKKSPRAFCAPIRVPDEVRLVIMPRGGQDDYQALLHEAGHAEHFGSVDPRQPFEYRFLGDNSVTEAYAFLYHYLTTDPLWVKQFTGLDDQEYIRFVYLNKLYMLRRYAAKFIYELKLHGPGEMKGKSRFYAEILSDATRVAYPPDHYLTDLDQGFYSAQYLRAWIFEAQLRARLRERFGRDWWNDPGVGEFLKGLWSSGQKFNVVELAQQVGYTGLDLEPLIEEIEEALA